MKPLPPVAPPPAIVNEPFGAYMLPLIVLPFPVMEMSPPATNTGSFELGPNVVKVLFVDETEMDPVANHVYPMALPPVNEMSPSMQYRPFPAASPAATVAT